MFHSEEYTTIYDSKILKYQLLIIKDIHSQSIYMHNPKGYGETPKYYQHLLR